MLRRSLIAGIILAPCLQVIAVDLQAHGRTADIETACNIFSSPALASTVTPFPDAPIPGAG